MDAGKLPDPGFDLWLEFEHCVPQPNDDPAVGFFNMQITLPSGLRYALNVWTYGVLPVLRELDRQSGDNLGGAYLLPPDLFVERCDRALIESIVAHLVQSGGLRDEWLVPPDDPDESADDPDPDGEDPLWEQFAATARAAGWIVEP